MLFYCPFSKSARYQSHLHNPAPAIRTNKCNSTRLNPYGLRKVRGCTHQKFTLHCVLVQQPSHQKSKLTCFIDYKAAFSSVNRHLTLQLCHRLGTIGLFVTTTDCQQASVYQSTAWTTKPSTVTTTHCCSVIARIQLEVLEVGLQINATKTETIPVGPSTPERRPITLS